MSDDEDLVFEALADPNRRTLLDLLFVQDGRTLVELVFELNFSLNRTIGAGSEITRFGVMKHLKVLEEASPVVSRKAGREKLHFLNPVPIRLIHDRWIDKYAERWVTRSPISSPDWRTHHDQRQHRRRRHHHPRRRSRLDHRQGVPRVHQGLP